MERGRIVMPKHLAIAEKVCWYCALFMALMLVMSICLEDQKERDYFLKQSIQWKEEMVKKPCDEIYVVKEGETLNTISEKCGDPYIVEENPHIHDPDDVFPGLVIKISPFKSSLNR
ncbi:hypothetical protein Ancab_031645 [Ancistrocladus abbreviatus]